MEQRSHLQSDGEYVRTPVKIAGADVGDGCESEERGSKERESEERGSEERGSEERERAAFIFRRAVC